MTPFIDSKLPSPRSFNAFPQTVRFFHNCYGNSQFSLLRCRSLLRFKVTSALSYALGSLLPRNNSLCSTHFYLSLQKRVFHYGMKYSLVSIKLYCDHASSTLTSSVILVHHTSTQVPASFYNAHNMYVNCIHALNPRFLPMDGLNC